MTGEATMNEVLLAERALYRAMIAKDFAALQRILAPDLVYAHSTAVAETKQEYLAGVAAGLYDYESIVSHDVRVR
ncbi:MAG: nuclear transport factor 2 family protein, partial [Betaproteobacteria bacterium]